MNNISGKNDGYADFTNMVATVEVDSENDLVVRAGFKSYNFTEYFGAWVDFNQNGVFEDNERLVEASSSCKLNKTFKVQIPSNAKLGKTRMRVSMKFGSKQTPCELFSDGEVEDYTIQIIEKLNRKESFTKNEVKNQSFLLEMIVYPNPSTNIIHIKVPSVSIEKGFYKIKDINGKVVKEDKFSEIINVEKLASGNYFINVVDGQNSYNKRFVKE